MTTEHVFPQALQAGDLAQATGGMTLRDYFAAQALPLAFKYFTEGIDSKEKRFIPNDLFSLYENDSGQDIHLVAKTAYAMADAMLAARRQPTV